MQGYCQSAFGAIRASSMACKLPRNSHRASGRESVSRWNTGMPTNELAPPDHREFSLLAGTDSPRDPQAAAPPDFSFLVSAPSRFR